MLDFLKRKLNKEAVNSQVKADNETAKQANLPKPKEQKDPPAGLAMRGNSKGRKLNGVVISDKMQKTAVVVITYSKLHQKYKKYFKVTRHFKAHNENNEYKIGDKVIIQETRPLSKEKRWVIVSKT